MLGVSLKTRFLTTLPSFGVEFMLDWEVKAKTSRSTPEARKRRFAAA